MMKCMCPQDFLRYSLFLRALISFDGSPLGIKYGRLGH